MPTREQVKRWFDEWAREQALMGGEAYPVKEMAAMADMLERAAEVARLAVWGDGRATSAAEMWLAEWNGEVDDGS